MVRAEPSFMGELHKIRAQLTREWRRKAPAEMLAALRQARANLQGKRTETTKRHSK